MVDQRGDRSFLLRTVLECIAYASIMLATKVAAVFIFTATPFKEAYNIAMDAGVQMDPLLFGVWFIGGGTIAFLHYWHGWKMIWFIIVWTLFIQVVETFLLR